MTRTGFLTLCLATVVAVALATFSVLRQPRMSSPDVAGDPLFPGLIDKLNTLKTVAVKQADGDLTFDRNDKTWTVRERHGYPADGEKVDAIVLAMARMAKLEAKTAAPDRLERLDLTDPKAKNSRSHEIVLLDRDSKILADLIVGKRKFTLGSKEGGTYVRFPNSPQSWLAIGEINPGAKTRDWLKRDMVDLKDKDVKRVTVTHPDGEKIVAGKLTPNDQGFAIENLPAGKKPASDFVGDDFGRLAAAMLADDVAKADDVPFPKDKTTTADIDTFGGLRVTLQLTEKDGNSWVKIKAEPPPGGAPAAKTPEAKPADAKPGDAKPGAATAAAAGPDWAKIANDINARSDGWVYEVPAYEVAAMRKHMADLIKKPEAKS